MGLRPTKMDKTSLPSVVAPASRLAVAGASRPAHEYAAGVDAASTAGLETSATFFEGA